MSAARAAMIERLARLQRQSGARDVVAAAGDQRTVIESSTVAGTGHARDLVPDPTDRSRALPAPADTAAGVDALRRLLARREMRPVTSTAMPVTMRSPSGVDRELPGDPIAPGLRFVERIIDCERPAAALQPERVDCPPVVPSQWLCFDTETTGLAGGSGTRAFMIGAADWTDRGLRLRQLYLDAMAGEPAMLATFAGWLDRSRVLVSYNGRCYDAPLLATRFRLARHGNPLTGLAHVDLLYPVRRRYRGSWENCRLATVERELLRVVREDDLPGAQAPAAWLHYLRGGSASRLRQVLRHNAQDLVSLARLLCVLHASDQTAI